LCKQSCDVRSGLFGKAVEDCHLSRQELFLSSIHSIPAMNFLGARCQLRILWDDPHFLLPRDYLFSQLVPTFIELAFIFVSPLSGDMMRRVARAGCEVNIERLIRSK